MRVGRTEVCGGGIKRNLLRLAYEDERFPTAQRRAELADQAGITPRCAGAAAPPYEQRGE